MERDTAYELADDLRSLASLIQLNYEDLPESFYCSPHSMIWKWTPDVREAGGVPTVLAGAMRAGLKFDGCDIKKEYTDSRFRLQLTMPNEHITYEITAQRDEVCTKRVTGTQMVEKDVPPDGEWTKKMVEEDVVEWDCHPLLSIVKDN